MHILRWAGVWLFSVFIGLAGCSSTEKLEPVELTAITPEIELVELWNQRLGGYDDKLLIYAPVIAGDKLFVMNHEGLVAALNKANGRTLWRQKLKQDISGGMGADSRHVYVALFDGRVLALSQEDGSSKWEASVSSEVLAAPQSTGNLVVVQTIDGKVFGLDAETGRQQWVYSSAQPALTLRGTATPLVTPEATFAGFANGNVVGIDNATGIAAWERKVGVPTGRTELERLVDIDGGIILDESLLYTVSYQGKVAALNASNGQEVWSKPASSLRKPASGYSHLYIVSADDDLIALSKLNQSSVWRQEGLKRRVLSSPAVMGSAVVVADDEGYAHFLSQVDGRFIARIRPSYDGIRATPLVVDGVVYFLGNNGRLSAWRIREPKN